MAILRGLEQRLTLRQLRAVCAIAQSGRLLAAAEAIGVSQPALTRTLHELETMFAVPLFDRHPRGVSPTEFGATVVDAARRILGEVADLESTINGIALRRAGALGVGTLPSAAAGLMPGVLAQLVEAAPALDIRLIQGRLDELQPVLRSGGIEMLIGRLYPADGEEEFASRVLYDEPISLLVRAGHKLATAGRPPALDELRAHRFILPTDSQRMAREVDAWFAELGLTPAHAVRTSAAATMRELLLAGDDILAVPALMMAGDMRRGAITALQPPSPAPPRPGGVLLRHGVALSDAATNVLRALRVQIRQLADAGIVGIR